MLVPLFQIPPSLFSLLPFSLSKTIHPKACDQIHWHHHLPKKVTNSKFSYLANWRAFSTTIKVLSDRICIWSMKFTAKTLLGWLKSSTCWPLELGQGWEGRGGIWSKGYFCHFFFGVSFWMKNRNSWQLE